MGKFSYILCLFFLFGAQNLLAQSNKEPLTITQDSIQKKEFKKGDINPLAPAKAAFYSAIVPGLGQAYNKKYWKIPLVYGALGIALYSYSWNNKKYHQFRDSYKRRLEGYSDDNLSYLDENRLIAGQKFYQKNRDLSAFMTVGIYILNILDANVDAHLLQFNVNDKLTLKPDLQQNDISFQQNIALTLNYHF